MEVILAILQQPMMLVLDSIRGINKDQTSVITSQRCKDKGRKHMHQPLSFGTLKIRPLRKKKKKKTDTNRKNN